MNVSIEKADSSQIHLIRKLAFEIWPATYRNILSSSQIDYMMEFIYSAAALKNQIENLGHQFIVVYDDKKPVGFASFGRKDKRTFKLHKIYVHQAMQGKGIGKRIIDYVTDEISKQNAEQLDLDVNRHNPARSFYEKLGFYILKEQDTDIGGGYFMNDYVMRKELTLQNKIPMEIKKVNLAEKFSQIGDHWNPRIAGELNGQFVKLVKFKGEFLWHKHDHEDELFFVLNGKFNMELRNETIEINENEFIIIPKGVEHRPVAEKEVSVILFEPASTLNTGNVRNERTREHLETI